MSDKHYIGLDVTSFENTGKHKPVSRVTLFVDEENYYTSGDDTGKEITASCPSATQEMADTLLAKFVGYEHQSFNAGSANIDPAAELGDGVTVGGIYATLSRVNDAGTGYAGISAADEPELEEEYPYLSPIQQEINRQSTEIRSLITKTAEEITLKVENLSENVGHTLRVAADGVTITDADGKTVTISGGQIDAKTIKAQDLNLSGVISFGDLSDAEDIQKQIDEAGGISASEASSIASTLITNTLVSSPTIQGATIKGGAYYDLLGYGKLMLSYSVDDGEETNRDNTTPWLKFLDAGNGDAELFEIVPLNKKSSSVGMLLGGTLALSAQNGVIYPSTAWDFSSVKATFG